MAQNSSIINLFEINCFVHEDDKGNKRNYRENEIAFLDMEVDNETFFSYNRYELLQ